MKKQTHRARKRFGQHFLTDEGVLQQIADVVALRADDQLLEIGPGPGALTGYLYGLAGRYLAVELDRDLIEPLKAWYPDLELIGADILKVDLEDLLTPPGWRVVGNLPYNISSPLLLKLYEHLSLIRDMHFMFQRELAERLHAEPGTRDWGRLSVVTQCFCEVEPLLNVPPEAFSPPPKIHSQVVRLTPRVEPESVDRARLDLVLRHAFSGRRKRIANALKGVAVDWDRVDIDPDRRPDELSVTEYVGLADALLTDED